MRDRSIKVTLRANVADFKREMAAAGTSFQDAVKKMDSGAKTAETGMGRMVQSMRAQRSEWDQVGSSLVAFGAVTTGAFVGSAKAASDWESQFAGVRKTVDASEAEFAALNDGLREMARSMPATHQEIAAVAEAAGQLGIHTENIEDFTETMLMMGEATSMSSEEAATQLARFANIMGTSQDEFSNMGSSIVELGNNFATTEGEITDLSLRLASAGRQIGLTEGDIFGMATALSSVGIEAEAGGTAFSRVMIELRKAVDTGSDKLDTFARVAGMTSEQFAAAFRDDAGGAITAFIQGLGDMEAAGESTQPVLEELGMTDVRVGNALRSSASAADLFTDAMIMGNAAYGENTALQDEYAARLETTEAQFQIFVNTIKDFAVSMGSVFLPAINEVLGPLQDFAAWMADLPEPILAVVGGLAGIGGILSLAAGGFALLAPRALDTYNAFKALQSANIPVISKALSGIGGISFKNLAKGAGWVGGLAAALALLDHAMTPVGATTEEYASALLDLASSGETASDALTNMYNGKWTLAPFRDEIQTTDEYLERLGSTLQSAWDGDWENKIARIIEPGAGSRAKDEIAELDAALAELVNSGHVDEAAAMFERFMQMATDLDLEISNEELRSYFSEYSAAAAEAVAAGEDVAGASQGAADGISEVANAAEEGANSVETYVSALFELAGINMSVDEAGIRYAETLREVNGLLEDEAFKTADATVQAEMKTSALIDLAKAGHGEVDAMAKQGASTDDLGRRTKDLAQNFLDTAQQMGLNQEEAFELAASYGLIPSDVKTQAEFETWLASYNAEAFNQLLDSVDGRVTTSTHRHETRYITTGDTLHAIRGGGSSYSTSAGSMRAGFSLGGYTGPGGVYEPAGIVHKGEIVWSQKDIAKAGGVGAVEAMRLGLRGYAGGGLVSARAFAPAVSVAVPSFEGAVVSGRLALAKDGFFDLVDGRIASNPGVVAANGLVRNMGRYRAQMGV